MVVRAFDFGVGAFGGWKTFDVGGRMLDRWGWAAGGKSMIRLYPAVNARLILSCN